MTLFKNDLAGTLSLDGVEEGRHQRAKVPLEQEILKLGLKRGCLREEGPKRQKVR